MRVGVEGGVWSLTLGRPGKLNAMDAAEWCGLHGALRKAEADPGARVVVLRAEGRAFCAGNDLAAMAGCETRAQARAYFVDTMLPAFEAMATSALPVVGVVQGMALGGGVELVQFCDLVVAAPSATFKLPEARVGVWATVFLGAAPYVGQRRLAQRLALTGEPLTASEALAAGLITHVAESDEALPVLAAEVAAQVAAGGRDAQAYGKRYANRALIADGLPAVRAALNDLIEHTMFGEEYEQGLGTFLRRTRDNAPGDRQRASRTGEGEATPEDTEAMDAEAAETGAAGTRAAGTRAAKSLREEW